MANNESTTKFKADISELKKSFQEAQQQIRVLNSEFKASSAALDDWSSDADGLSAKIKQLNGVLDAEKVKLKSLEDQYKRTAEEQGENSEGAKNLLIKVNNQKAAVENCKKELKKYSDKLEEMESESEDAEEAADGLSDKFDDLGEAAEKSGDGFTIAKGVIANFISEGLMALAGAAKDAITNLTGLAESTRDYRADMAKLETAFTTAGFTAEEATGVYKDFYAVLGDEGKSVEAVSHLAKLTDSQKELEDWTRICTGIWGTYGDSLPIEGLTEAANETAKVGKVTGPLADALNWAGESEDEFNEKLAECSTEQERQQLITETLSDLYSDAAKKYEEVNESVMDANRATSDFKDTQAKLGEKIEPITTKVKKGFADVLTAILELVDGADFSKVKTAVDKGFGWLIKTGLPAIKTGFGWIIDHKDVLIAGIAGIGAALLTLNVVKIITGVVEAFKAFKAAQEGATAAQWLLNAALNANPIGIVIALIAGLVTAFVVLWNKSDAFREFFISAWESIKDKVGSIVSAISDFFTNLRDKIKNAFSNIDGWFSDKFKAAWSKIKGVFSAPGEFFSGVWSAIKKPFSSVATWFKDTFSEAWKEVKDVFSTGGKIFDGIKDGIADTFKTVVNGLIGGINKVVAVPFNAINGALKKIRDISIAGVEPFKNLISTIDVPQIPLLARGGVLKRGQVGLLEGSGAEAVVPLENNKGWLDQIAGRLSHKLGFGGGNNTQAVPPVVNNNFYQTNNSPKPLNRLEIYRQSKNLLSLRR